jgi:hypothetical protein
MKRKGIRCRNPKCDADLLITGWTVHSEQTASYMKFKGSGAVQIASTVAAGHKVTCLLCGEPVKLTPIEMMRASV